MERSGQNTSRRRYDIKVDESVYVLLLTLRNAYSQRYKKNVSLGWIVKSLAEERANSLKVKGSVFEQFFGRVEAVQE